MLCKQLLVTKAYGASFVSKLFRFPNTTKHFPIFKKLLLSIWLAVGKKFQEDEMFDLQAGKKVASG